MPLAEFFSCVVVGVEGVRVAGATHLPGETGSSLAPEMFKKREIAVKPFTL
jgi:hypothetical protein